MSKTALRTDDTCFDNLPGFDFSPQYTEVLHTDYAPLRMHYLDEGERDNPVATVLLLHGCPAWCYLYRKVIPPLVAAGCRVIAPDHIGCGRSDKLLAREDYSYNFYVDCLTQLIDNLALNDITLVCQDWGGPIGLRTVANQPARFSRILLTNTLLPNSEAPPAGIADWPGEMITNWISFTANADDLPIGGIIQGVTVSDLNDEIVAAYDAPYPDATYKQGIMNWPSLIPLHENSVGTSENRKAWKILEQLDLPFLTAFSDSDPSTADWEAVFQQRLNGASGLNHEKITGAGHMVQEDKGEELAAVILRFIESSQAL